MLSPRKLVHHSQNTLMGEIPHVEVENKANAQVRELQIGQHLGLVHPVEFGDRLHFDDHAVLHNQIHSVRAIQLDALVDQR